MSASQWQDVETYVRGPGLLLVLQVFYWIVAIAVVVYKWVNRKRVAVTEHRRETRRKYRWIYRYDPTTDPKHMSVVNPHHRPVIDPHHPNWYHP